MKIVELTQVPSLEEALARCPKIVAKYEGYENVLRVTKQEHASNYRGRLKIHSYWTNVEGRLFFLCEDMVHTKGLHLLNEIDGPNSCLDTTPFSVGRPYCQEADNPTIRLHLEEHIVPRTSEGRQFIKCLGAWATTLQFPVSL